MAGTARPICAQLAVQEAGLGASSFLSLGLSLMQARPWVRALLEHWRGGAWRQAQLIKTCRAS
jgi:hypothetical protein